MTFLFYTYLVYVHCVGAHMHCGMDVEAKGQPMGVSSLLVLCGYHSRSPSMVVRFGRKCLSMLNHHTALHYDPFIHAYVLIFQSHSSPLSSLTVICPHFPLPLIAYF